MDERKAKVYELCEGLYSIMCDAVKPYDNMEIIRAKEQQHEQSYDRSHYDRGGGMSR